MFCLKLGWVQYFDLVSLRNVKMDNETKSSTAWSNCIVKIFDCYMNFKICSEARWSPSQPFSQILKDGHSQFWKILFNRLLANQVYLLEWFTQPSNLKNLKVGVFEHSMLLVKSSLWKFFLYNTKKELARKKKLFMDSLSLSYPMFRETMLCSIFT